MIFGLFEYQFALILTHSISLGIFWLLGVVLVRHQVASPFHRDLWNNLATGLGIFIFIKPLMSFFQEQTLFQLFPLDWGSDWLHALFAFLLIDISRYWLHFMHHRVPFFWQFHRVHHSSTQLDSSSGLRMHFVDFIQLACIPIFWFGVVFDISSWNGGIIPFVLSIGVIFDAFQHGNIPFNIQHPVGKIWNRVLNNPHFHAWHHVQDAQLCDGNYGNVLLFWDRLFKTEVTQAELPPAYGLMPEQALENSPIAMQLLKTPNSL